MVAGLGRQQEYMQIHAALLLQKIAGVVLPTEPFLNLVSTNISILEYLSIPLPENTKTQPPNSRRL